jgi:hypothetical protein
MKYVKMIGLAAAAAMALMAFLASSASATTLTSPAGTTLPEGTVIEATLKGSAVLEETGGTTLDTCTSSTVSGKTTNKGGDGAGEPVTGNIETLDWGGCIAPTVSLKNADNTYGSLSVEATGGGNGTVSGKNSRVTVGIFGVSCIYGTGAGTVLGTATGGEPATIDINAAINLQEGGILCPPTTKWTATYTITKPNPLFVD